jgi:cytoskeletal protein RodZ
MFEISEKLKAARAGRGVSLEEISSRTRINIAYLRYMEEGKFDFLPRPIVNGFLKTFAKEVGLDGYALAAQLQPPPPAEVAPAVAPPEMRKQPAVAVSARPAPGQADFTITPSGFPYLKEIAIGLGALLVMALLLYWVARAPESEPQTEVAAEEEVSKKTQPGNGPVQEISLEQMAAEPAQQPQADSTVTSKPAQVTLEARFKDRVWLAVTIDDSLKSDSIYRAGMSKSWSAKKNFRLSMGNAGAVTLLLDGKDLGEIGKPGQVADIVITPAGIMEKRLRQPQRRKAPEIPRVRTRLN